jgi:hypothetical protein
MTGKGEENDRGGATAWYCLAAVTFLVSRLLVLPFSQPASDVGIYAEYAHEVMTAASEGRSFYELHAAHVHGEARGRLAGAGDEYRDVEYPPLAIEVLRLPLLWMRQPETDQPGDFAAAYATAYRRGLAVVDVLLFLTVAWLVRRIYSAEEPHRQAGRLLFYVAGTLALWHLLYDRLDLIQAMGVTLALALLVGRRHYAWSFAVLALAINFKLVPLVLAPVWVVGALPAYRPLSVSWPTVGRLAVRALLLAALTLAVLLPFYIWFGGDCLGFLRYHRARGLEVESVWSCLPLALHAFGRPVEVAYSYGSVNVDSSLTPILARLSPVATAVVLLAVTALLLVRARRMASAERRQDGVATLAQLFPAEFAAFTLLVLMVFVAANKVFSPQYLLWLLPLAALVPFEGRLRRAFLAGFLLVCVLSTVLMPFLFVFDLLVPAPPGGVPLFRPPTARFVVVLLLRNLLFLGLTTALAITLGRKPIGGEEDAPRTSSPGP